MLKDTVMEEVNLGGTYTDLGTNTNNNDGGKTNRPIEGDSMIEKNSVKGSHVIDSFLTRSQLTHKSDNLDKKRVSFDVSNLKR